MKTYKVNLGGGGGRGVFPYSKYTVDLLVRVDLKSFHKSTNLFFILNIGRPLSFHISTNGLFISLIGRPTIFSYIISVDP